MEPFVYTGLPARVVFGRGTVGTLQDEVRRLGARRALVLSTAEQSAQGEAISRALGALSGGLFAGAVMHTPVSVTEAALEVLRESEADCLVAIGGGSTTGLGKALAYRTKLPQIAIPTTYAGSEMTTILGQTEGARKTTLRDPLVLPKTVIYDVDLTVTLPAALSGTSGMNAIAHAVEALYAENSNPILTLLAEQGIAALARSLPVIARTPHDIEARSDALYGAWLCGVCLGSSGIAIHHKLCHVLGGTFALPHAETHTIVLPHAVAYNAPSVPHAMAVLKRALRADDPCDALFQMGRSIGAPSGLAALGMPRAGIDQAVAITLESPYWNPRPLEAGGLRRLLERAWDGSPPRID